ISARLSRLVARPAATFATATGSTSSAAGAVTAGAAGPGAPAPASKRLRGRSPMASSAPSSAGPSRSARPAWKSRVARAESMAPKLCPCPRPRKRPHSPLPAPQSFAISGLSRGPGAFMTFRARHLLGIEHLAPEEIRSVLDLSEKYVELNRRTVKHADALAGMTQINMFFEASTRTQASFELAGKRLGADVMNMSVAHSSVKKGETLIDTALTLNAMHPDLLVVRHPASGAVDLLAQKVNCAVLNAGDGRHEHPTQALLDALTIRRAKGRLHRLTVAICGDIAHSRVARSNLILLGKME